jgi:membrane-bound serine protease (ClpP class)
MTLPTRHPGWSCRRLPALGLLLAIVAVVAASVLGTSVAAAPAAGAQTPTGTATSSAPSNDPGIAAPGVVSVVTVDGLVDPIIEDLMRQSIVAANDARAVSLVFQVDLQDSVIPDDQLVGLINDMRESAVPVNIWIGPSGSQLGGKATWLVLGARQLTMAPGTTVGPAEPLTVTPPDSSVLGAARAPALANRLDAQQASDAKVTDRDAPTLGDFVVGLPGVQTKQTTVNGQPKLQPVTQVVFSQLSILDGFFHTAASPAVAYLMLAVGIALLIFELFTAGVGVAGVIGAAAFTMACYGLTVLPARGWAVALLVLAMVAFAVDVQTGVPRFWTGAGLVLFGIGSLFLYDGVAMSWVTIVIGLVAVALAFLAGMPSMVRTRFSTPTIGREWMVGEEGRAATDIDPDGVVQIKGAPWRAYTNRATPISQLDKVRVIGIEGLVLEVEPTEGAARDYRERRPRTSDA